MSSVLRSDGTDAGSARLPSAWLVAIGGFAAMYVPLYWWAARTIWQSEDQGHGAIILAVLLWLFWTLRRDIDQAPVKPVPALGWPIFVFGLFVYFVGRVFEISILEFGSQPFVLAGALLLMRGTSAIRAAWFPLLYFIFMVPLPGILVDAITGSLKGLIANIVESLLYTLGYPIARSGVILSIGPYQLQVADACSGLHSMFSLSALGTLFMYIMGPKSRLHLGIMLASILPIAFAANIIRVVTLVLVTYYLGDEAGQGFLHGAAGMVLMLVALVLFFLLDVLLDKLLPGRRTRPGGGDRGARA
ncbi:MAG: exosortase B [Betaproteobacteria bacterium]|nr:exosortase B [Betaproteobacteria bacterium]